MQQRLDRAYVERYFSKTGTVARWWEPESDAVNPRQRQCYAEERRRVIEFVRPQGKAILDLCTGKGRFAIELARAGAARVVAVDISREMLNIASARAEEAGVGRIVEFKLAKADDTGERGSSFDAAVCIQALMHVPDPAAVIRELARVTRPRGSIAVDHVNVQPWWMLTWGSKRDLGIFLIKQMLVSRPLNPLRRWLERTLERPMPMPIWTGITRDTFRDTILRSELEISEIAELGPAWCPAYFLATCWRI